MPIPAVATISASYRFEGFSAPVDNEPAVNLANAGRSIPVRFSLNGDERHLKARSD